MSKRKGKRSTKDKCPDCGKKLRMGSGIKISGGLNSNTPRNSDGSLKRSREVDYQKECRNPRCPSNNVDEEE